MQGGDAVSSVLVAKRKNGPVQVRSINDPKPGWTQENAIDLLRQGYTPAQVARMTGFDETFLSHQDENSAGRGISGR